MGYFARLSDDEMKVYEFGQRLWRRRICRDVTRTIMGLWCWFCLWQCG